MENASGQYDDLLYRLAALRWELAAIRFDRSMDRLGRLLKAYDPDQPRVPAGNPDGGQWSGNRNIDRTESPSDRPRTIAQSSYSFGDLVGQSRIRGGGFVCFYKFDFGIVMVDGAVNLGCPLRVPSAAVRHGNLIGNDN